MLCYHCNTPFEILPLDEGKSKYCKKCGLLIYKKENNAILIYQPETTTTKQDEESEIRELIIREKELRYKEQLERKQKEQEFRERLEQIRLLKEKEEEARKIKEKEEQERMFQLQLEEEKRLQESSLKAQIAKEQQERERLEKEMQLQEQLKLQLEQKIEEAKKLEALQLAYDEQIKAEKIKLEQERIALEKKEQEILQQKEAARIQFATVNEMPKNVLVKNIESSAKHRMKYAALLFAGILLAAVFMFFKNKVSFLAKTKNNATVLASVDTNKSAIPFDYNTDTVLLQQLRTNLIGRDILSWNNIKDKDIKNITILSADENDVNSRYTVVLNLADGITRASAELNLSYNKIILNKIETTKITYSNIAPTNAWFSFVPLPNCSISINTNNNPIQLKTCDDCTITKILSTKEAEHEIANSEYIYIKSDTRYEASVDFTYLPLSH